MILAPYGLAGVITGQLYQESDTVIMFACICSDPGPIWFSWSDHRAVVPGVRHKHTEITRGVATILRPQGCRPREPAPNAPGCRGRGR